jgi:hypothetical protein
VTRASSTNQADVAVGADADDVVASNSDVFRAAPLAVGGGAVLALLVNRIFSHVAPVADASSSQSRADVLCLAMAGCLVLTGRVVGVNGELAPHFSFVVYILAN